MGRTYEVTVRMYADPDRNEFDDVDTVYRTTATSERKAISNVGYRTGKRFTQARPRYDDGRHLYEVIGVRDVSVPVGQEPLF